MGLTLKVKMQNSKLSWNWYGIPVPSFLVSKQYRESAREYFTRFIGDN